MLQDISRQTGYPWERIRIWLRREAEYQEVVTSRRLGKAGLRPFGSNRAVRYAGRGTTQGARLAKPGKT